MYKEDRRWLVQQQQQMMQQFQQQQQQQTLEQQKQRSSVHLPQTEEEIHPHQKPVQHSYTRVRQPPLPPKVQTQRPHPNHIRLRSILVDKQQSEPNTPICRNPDKPMCRNLSDLGPRIKKRVTYRCTSHSDIDAIAGRTISPPPDGVHVHTQTGVSFTQSMSHPPYPGTAVPHHTQPEPIREQLSVGDSPRNSVCSDTEQTNTKIQPPPTYQESHLLPRSQTDDDTAAEKNHNLAKFTLDNELTDRNTQFSDRELSGNELDESFNSTYSSAARSEGLLSEGEESIGELGSSDHPLESNCLLRRGSECSVEDEDGAASDTKMESQSFLHRDKRQLLRSDHS